jgi:hypothetical protein
LERALLPTLGFVSVKEEGADGCCKRCGRAAMLIILGDFATRKFRGFETHAVNAQKLALDFENVVY